MQPILIANFSENENSECTNSYPNDSTGISNTIVQIIRLFLNNTNNIPTWFSYRKSHI